MLVVWGNSLVNDRKGSNISKVFWKGLSWWVPLYTNCYFCEVKKTQKVIPSFYKLWKQKHTEVFIVKIPTMQKQCLPAHLFFGGNLKKKNQFICRNLRTSHLSNIIGDELGTVCFQAWEREEPCSPHHPHDVVHSGHVNQGSTAHTLQPRKKVHVRSTQHIIGRLPRQLSKENVINK